MVTHTFKIRARDDAIFKAIKNRVKDVETRAATKRFKNIQVGDTILFTCGDRKIRRKVKRVRYFPSIRVIAIIYDSRRVNPFCRWESDLRRMYYSFPGYKEKIRKYGLVAFELEA